MLLHRCLIKKYTHIRYDIIATNASDFDSFTEKVVLPLYVFLLTVTDVIPGKRTNVFVLSTSEESPLFLSIQLELTSILNV